MTAPLRRKRHRTRAGEIKIRYQTERNRIGLFDALRTHRCDDARPSVRASDCASAAASLLAAVNRSRNPTLCPAHSQTRSIRNASYWKSFDARAATGPWSGGMGWAQGCTTSATHAS